MTDSETITASLEKLQTLAKRYHRFQEDPQLFLDELSRSGDETLGEFLDSSQAWVTQTVDGVEQIRPVVFLQRVVVTRILDRQRVLIDDLVDIGERIEAKDTDYFKDFPNYLDALVSQKERKRSAFTNWRPFNVLFFPDYRPRRTLVKEALGEVARFLRKRLDLEDFEFHLAGFNFNQGFGTDHCWVAIYPTEAGDHKNAYQLFAGIEHDRYGYGVLPGSRVEGGERTEETKKTEEFDLDTMLSFLEDKRALFFEKNRELKFGSKVTPKRQYPLNTILYGPPGTGKTYSLQRRAVEIIKGDTSGLSNQEIGGLFRKHLTEGRIEFITFHASYSYEEFVEGFRFDPDEKIPVLRDGTFVRMVKRALNPDRKAAPVAADIWKISLGDKSEQWVFERCMENEEITIGWFDDIDMTGMDREAIKGVFEENEHGGETNNIRSVNYFINELNEGDYVAVLKDQRTIRAIGVVDGPYRYADEYEGYRHARSVRWLDKKDHDVYDMNGNHYIGMPTLYKLNHLNMRDLAELLPQRSRRQSPYVLIIDEINRGNISKIFGELITLLEPDKRQGAENELEIRLPYSQTLFSVPSNLLVLGTMNTADRSIALLDVALRRRFYFEEMMPDVAIVRSELSERCDSDPDSELSSENVDLICDVFQTLNQRITVLLDRDHQLGHSYFLKLRSVTELRSVLYERVFPLLQEYFYNDRDRLARLLGTYVPGESRGFVKTLRSEYSSAFNGDDLEGDEVPWELHRYKVGELEDALKMTFLDQ